MDMIDRDKLLDNLGNVHDFLRAIDDPGAEAVAIAAGIISGELEWHPAARLLTLGEVREWKDFLWMEVNPAYTEDRQGRLFRAVAVRDGQADDVLTFHLRETPNVHKVGPVYYGASIRCWAEKPTPEDMEGVAWDEDAE